MDQMTGARGATAWFAPSTAVMLSIAVELEMDLEKWVCDATKHWVQHDVVESRNVSFPTVHVECGLLT